jgi:WhiB family redox-sensing transcriptional regulator
MTVSMPDFEYPADCTQTDPEAFFVVREVTDDEWETNESVAQRKEFAKSVCIGCLARRECLEYAVDHDERWGIWGGEDMEQMKMDQRNALQRRRRLKVAS